MLMQVRYIKEKLTENLFRCLVSRDIVNILKVEFFLDLVPGKKPSKEAEILLL